MHRRSSGAALLAVIGLVATASSGASAGSLQLEPGKPVDLVCETRAVSVADEAQATTGSVRLRIEAAQQVAVGGAPGKPDSAQEQQSAPPNAPSPSAPRAGAQHEPVAGRWSIADVPAAHVASFALKQREACASAACPFEPGQGDHSLHLWAPAKMMPDKLAAGASMSLASLDLVSLALRVSTFRDGAIAALEQGDCKLAP